MSVRADSKFEPTWKIPGPPAGNIFGVVAKQTQFDRDPIKYMTKQRARYGNLIRHEHTGDLTLFAFGPEYNRIIHAETDRFHSRPFVLPGPDGSAQSRLRHSLFRLNGSDHHNMRHHLLPPFQRTALPHYYETLVGLVDRTTGEWRPGQVRNLQRDMHMMVWGVVRGLLYGLEESAATEALHHSMEEWMFDTFSPWVRGLPFNLPFTPFRRMLRRAENLEKQFLAIIASKRAAGGVQRDALSQLINARMENGHPIPNHRLLGHAVTLFLVAYETTGNTLMWTLFLLAQHPDIQHALLDELAPFRGAPPPIDKLERLPVLNRILKESTRILPAVPYNRRITSCPGPMGRYWVPKGARVVFSHYITHHMPELFTEPERFSPERWETIKPSPAEYMPFGAGARTCLGAAMAQFVIRIALTMIVPAWRLTVVPNTQIDRHLGISLGAQDGIPVIVQPQDRQLEASPIRGNINEMVDLKPRAMPILRRAIAA